MAKERTCIKCRQSKDIKFFQPSSSPFMPGGHAIICTPCLGRMIEQDNMDSVDQLCRYLDIPFDPNEWTRLYATHGDEDTLRAYFELLSDDHYSSSTWAIENERWRLARESGTMEEEIEILDQAELRRLRNKWSDAYNTRELKFLEEYYNQICASQVVNTPILRTYACDLCEIELQIKKGVRAGDDVKKLMDARDNIIKMAHFEANNSKNAADFESVGEVIMYYVKKGWHPDWQTEPKDSIDFLMTNIQNYLRRLVTNEGNLAEQVEDKRAQYNITERLEHDEQDYGFDEAVESINFEDEAGLLLDIDEGV